MSKQNNNAALVGAQNDPNWRFIDYWKKTDSLSVENVWWK